jgi:hypothetical protein
VFDESTLDVVMGELDTVTDLTGYLAKKETLIRSGRLVSAAGEEELVGQYMIRMNAAGEHDFTKPDGTAWSDNDHVVFGGGGYTAVKSNPQYLAKKEADKVSYAWDRLITMFTDTMLAGTSLVPDGQPTGIEYQEQGVRQMALLSRFSRRSHGGGVLDALEQGQKADKFMRAFIPGPGQPRSDSGFFFLTVKVPKIELDGGYEQYRAVRRNILEAYALNLLRKNPQLKMIVGVATEPKPPAGEKPGSSEELIYAEPPEWTEKLLGELEERKKFYGIDQPGNAREWAIGDREFPEVRKVATQQQEPGRRLTRRERRALSAERRRQERDRRR